jgi:hypothetical protein
MSGTNCDLFTHNQSRSYLNHLVSACRLKLEQFLCFLFTSFNDAAVYRDVMSSDTWR